jgi:hypothetical protein
MNPALVGGAVLIILLIAVAVYMSSQSNVSTTDNKNETPAEEEDPVAEAGEQPAAKMAAEQEVLSDAQEDDEKKEEKIVEEEDVVKEVPPKDEPATKPSEVSGLVGWFEPKNFDYKKGQWTDSSGRGNHATEIKGRPEKVTEDNVTFIMGGNATGIRFPTKVMTRGRKFTMFTVARYNGGRQGRIIEGYGGHANFLSGFHWWRNSEDGSVGGSHRSGTGWISDPHYRRNMSDEQEAKWVLNVEQKHLHRMDGHQRSGQTNGRARIPLQMSINHGDFTPHSHNAYWAKQQSDWAAGDIVFYNRELSLEEIRKVETYLMRKYKIEREMRPSWRNRNFYARERGWLNPFPDCRGAACAEQFKSLGSNRMGSDCGPEGAMSRSYFHRHHRTHPRGANGNYWFGNNCLHGLEGGIEEKKTNYIDITSGKQWHEKGKRELWEMDCKGQGIAGFRYESSADKSRLRLKYKCHQAPVDEDSCREIDASRWGKDYGQRHKNTWNNDRHRDGGPFSAMEGQDLNCGDGQVLTKMQYADGDNGEVRFKGQCCNLADV